jgi:WD40 repeat protein
VAKLESPKYACYDISFSANGKFFLAPSYDDGFVRIWSLPLLKLHREFKHGKSADTACFTADENLILSGGDDKVIRLWDIENDRQENTYEGHEKPLRLVRALADRERLVSVSSEGKVIVWGLKSGKQLKTWKLDNVPGLTDHYKIVAVAPKGNRLLAGHPDGLITVWDLDKGELVCKLEGHKKAVTAVDVTPDGRYALSGGADLTLRYWRLPATTAAAKDLPKAVEKK